MLMYVDMGWAETEFEEMVAGYALFYGGLAQLLVAIFELLKGSTFPFAVFGSYGAFWLGWGLVFLETHRNTSEFTGDYTDGKTFWFIQWGVLTTCFFGIALRKNYCLMVVLGLLALTFYMLAAAAGSEDPNVKKAAGYFGFATAIAAWYTAVAEIANEEYGRHVLPGLKPVLQPEREELSVANIRKRAAYDPKTNTMFLQFRGLHIKTQKDIRNIQVALEEAFQSTKHDKVHVVVDYEDALIADDIFGDYWSMVAELERNYYLSAKRFHVTSFGTGSSTLAGDASGMRQVAANWTGHGGNTNHNGGAVSEEAAKPRSNRNLQQEGDPSF